MIVYHGSICEVVEPNVKMAKNRLDFGRAFYVTSYRRQAEKWALRKAARTQGVPIVSVYQLSEIQEGLRVKDFGETDGEWLDFVCACRAGKGVWRSYDIIRGRVANDDVFKTVDAYLKGKMSRDEALRQLRYAKPNDQIALTTTRGVKTILKFKRSYKVNWS